MILNYSLSVESHSSKGGINNIEIIILFVLGLVLFCSRQYN